jgi:hypothetical protein
MPVVSKAFFLPPCLRFFIKDYTIYLDTKYLDVKTLCDILYIDDTR